MGDPTYSYQLKPRKKDDLIWINHFYLYINKVHCGNNYSKYIGQVDASDKRVQLILEKRANDKALRELAEIDAKRYFD